VIKTVWEEFEEAAAGSGDYVGTWIRLEREEIIHTSEYDDFPTGESHWKAQVPLDSFGIESASREICLLRAKRVLEKTAKIAIDCGLIS
jgi:hypothetical protein